MIAKRVGFITVYLIKFVALNEFQSEVEAE
jgi:hypothetical protein